MFWLGFVVGGILGVFVGVVFACCYSMSGSKSECERCDARQLWDSLDAYTWEAGQ